uniref:Ty3 transposon capsid-like protein domain-containing protein n=1 Tax=Fagus sylvatica TaxID=28930 RepID=A0A2N9EPT7_FAGSY
MVQETRAGVTMVVLDEKVQRLGTQIEGNSGAIKQLYTKFDRLEAKVDIGFDNLQAMMRELLQKQPVVEQPAVQPRQEEQTPNRVQANLVEQIPIAPREAQGVPLGAEMRKAMPMRQLNQDFRVQANQPRVGMRMGEEGGKEWQQGQQGQQAQFEPHAAPPRHGMHFSDPREDQWGWNDQNEAWFDPGGGRPARERPRQWQGAHHRDPYWQEQDGPPWHQGGASSNWVQANFANSMRAELRNVRPMRAPNHEVHFNPNQPRFGMPYDDPFEPRRKRLNGGVFLNPIVESLCGLGNARPPPSFEGQCGLYGEEYWREKRFPRQQQQFHTCGQQAQPQRHASQAREPRNAPWPQGDVVEPWYDHGGGRGNCGRARNYQGPQDRDPYGKNQDPLQRQQGRQAREPRAMELEFPRFKGGDPTSWMFRAIQYFEYYQVHDASKVIHASYHLDDDALIWFQSCEHDLGCWDNFARAIQLRFGPPSYDDPMELLIKLKHVNSIKEYKGLFESLSNRIRNLSSMHKLSCFMSGLKDEVRLAIKMQGPRTLGEAYALAKIQEQYLANVKRSTRPSYEVNKDNWEQYSSQEVAAQFGSKVATQSDPKVTECDPDVTAQIVPKVVAQFDPKVAAQLDPKVAVQFDPKVAAQLNPKVAAQMDPKVVDHKPISARPTMMMQKLTPKQMLERRRKRSMLQL